MAEGVQLELLGAHFEGQARIHPAEEPWGSLPNHHRPTVDSDRQAAVEPLDRPKAWAGFDTQQMRLASTQQWMGPGWVEPQTWIEEPLWL